MIINFINCSGGGGSSSAITAELISVIDRSITSFDIPSGLTEIGENAFASCSGLTAITIPANVTEIDSNAFAGNRSLATITFESTTPPTVAADAFSQLPSGVTVNVPEGAEDAYATIIENILNSKAFIIEYTDLSGNTTVWYSKKPQVAWNDGTNEQPPMPDGGWAKIETKGIVTLDDNCFLNEMAVEYVFGDSVKVSNCTPIRGENPYSTPTKVTYKSTSFDYFDGRICENGFNISSITFYCPTAPSIIDDGYINSSHTANYGELFIPNGGKDYKAWKDFYCGEDWVVKDLSGNTMNLEMHYTDRNGWSGEYQFYNEIPSYFFADNSELVEVILPDACTDIKTGTFRGCSELTAVTIPSTCWRIQPQAFKDCVWLSDITCYASTAPDIGTRIGDESFGNVSPQGTLNIPTGASGYDAWTAQLGEGWTINYI